MMNSFLRKLRWLTQRPGKEAELREELRFHLEEDAEQRQQGGLPQDEARWAARRELGSVAAVQEDTRAAWGWPAVEQIGRDLRFARRSFAANRLFAFVAISSLALGIGANTAIFSILHALVLRSLPVSDPQSLVIVTRDETVSSPYPLFAEIRDQSRFLDGVLAFRTTACRFSEGDGTERISVALVSGGSFEVLGLAPAAGTTIAREDDQTPGSGGPRGPVAVLSHGFWMRQFGGSQRAIGARIRLNGQPFTVAGVAPPGFDGIEVGESPSVFVPMMMQPVLMPGMGEALAQPGSQWLRIFARLKTGATVQQAEAELTTLLQRYNEALLRDGNIPGTVRERLRLQRIVLLAGSAGLSGLRGQYAQPLWVLMLVVGVVLLIACANVANLLLSRAAARRREIAIRLGLGAARGRVIQQLLTESLLLAAAGAGLGVLLARWLRDVLVGYLPPEQRLAVPLDGNVLLFALGLTVGAALLFGLVPALQATRVDVAPALKSGDITLGPARGWLRQGLVIFQISLSCLLLFGAALFLRSLHNLLTVDPGFARENILVAAIEADGKLYGPLLEQVRALPGVTAAAMADSAPLGTHTGWNVYLPDYAPKANEPRQSPWVSFISPGYFATMQIPLLAGRDFSEQDAGSQQQVMIVNETFARHYFEGLNPIGRRVGVKEGLYDWEIVGVVKDSKYTGLRQEAVRSLYVPYRPGPWTSHRVVHLRTAGSPAALAAALRGKVHELDPTAALFDVHTVEQQIDRSLSRERLVGTVTSLFGGVALLLAAIGLYGLVSYSALRRTREFGIRVAIGANPRNIIGLVTGEALRLLAAGTAIGLAASWALGRAVQSMLFGIEAADPLSAALAVAVLLAAALFAAWVPARRASRIDPTRALRFE